MKEILVCPVCAVFVMDSVCRAKSFDRVATFQFVEKIKRCDHSNESLALSGILRQYVHLTE